MDGSLFAFGSQNVGTDRHIAKFTPVHPTSLAQTRNHGKPSSKHRYDVVQKYHREAQETGVSIVISSAGNVSCATQLKVDADIPFEHFLKAIAFAELRRARGSAVLQLGARTWPIAIFPRLCRNLERVHT